METIILNLAPKVRREIVNGRTYVVAPMRMIVSGVLEGSKGKLYYPPEEVVKDADNWNGIPIVVNHPIIDGIPSSARRPEVMGDSEIGRVYNAKGTEGKYLDGEAWFDEELTRRVTPSTLNKLDRGEKVELSTGLYTDNVKAPKGSNHNGTPYDYTAINYKPDHLAILPEHKGACSNDHGCGVLANQMVTDNSNPDGINQYSKGGAGKAAFASARKANSTNPLSKVDGGANTVLTRSKLAYKTGDKQDHLTAANYHDKMADKLEGKEPTKESARHHRDAAKLHRIAAHEPIKNEGHMPDLTTTVNAAASMMKEAGQMSDNACEASAQANTSGSKDDHVDAAKAHLDASKAHKGNAPQMTGGDAVKAAMMAKAHGKMADSHMDAARYGPSPGMQRNSSGQPTDREASINLLTTNCDCWKGDDKKSVLNGYSDDKLKELADEYIRNNSKQSTSTYVPPTNPIPTTNLVTNSTTSKESKAMTPEEYLSNAPEEIRVAINNSVRILNEAKSRIVDRLVVNVKEDRKQSHIEYLMKRDIKDLEMELERMPLGRQTTANSYQPNTYVPAPSYQGAAGGPIFNGSSNYQTDDETNDPPVINWADGAYEEPNHRGNRRNAS